MPVLRNIGQLATCRPAGAQGEIHTIPQAALAWKDGLVAWVGPEPDLPAAHRNERELDAEGRLVVPGLVDAHTHLAFGGWRAGEFRERALGRTYQEIAAAGGGILSTVQATRLQGEPELLHRCVAFVERMVALGITTIECKSGYCLDTEGELKLLRVYAELDRRGPAHIVPTFLGAHVVPPEYRDDRGAYVRLLVEEMLPAVAAGGLAGFCDAFVEQSAFTVEEAKLVLNAAARLGLPGKLHADQLTDGGGARLAAEVGAVSADHLEHVSDEGISALARAGVVAVSLPLAGLYLSQPPLNARRLIEAGVPVAVATDFNPGSAPSYHLPLALTLACVRQRMTPAEALKGATALAARAVGREDRIGSLEKGKSADFVVLDAPDVDTWLYHFEPNACVLTVIGGRVCWRRGPS